MTTIYSTKKHIDNIFPELYMLKKHNFLLLPPLNSNESLLVVKDSSFRLLINDLKENKVELYVKNGNVYLEYEMSEKYWYKLRVIRDKQVREQMEKHNLKTMKDFFLYQEEKKGHINYSTLKTYTVSGIQFLQ